MSDVPIIEILENLRVVTCPLCGVTHAIPVASFLIAQRDGKAIYCPQGHAWTPLLRDADKALNPVQTQIEMQSALADANIKLTALRRRVEELTPAGALSPKELRRRANLFAERAESKEFGRGVCPFCGKQKSSLVLAAHIRRSHRNELEERQPHESPGQ